jgi:hypothetical protein
LLEQCSGGFGLHADVAKLVAPRWSIFVRPAVFVHRSKLTEELSTSC